ncbi:MAG: hypothetical protein ACRCZI_13715 [Cetobacterium sp.]
MTEQEINHTIATQVNGWQYVEGIIYQDSAGNYCYRADYCNSIAHALDLAKAHQIGLAPNETGWQAYSIADANINSTDPIAAKSICLCLLSMHQAS